MLNLSKKEIFKLNKNLRLENLINDIADGFNQSYYDGITETSKDINNKPFKKLSPNTIADKKRRGLEYADTPLLAEGKMRNTYVKTRATQTNKQAIISLNVRDRGNISIKHNEGINVPKREWFGIGSVQKKIASKLAKLHINKALMK